MRNNKRNKVFVYFIDHDESYTEELLAKFDNSAKYIISTYNSSANFFNDFNKKLKYFNNTHIVFVSSNLEFDESGNLVDAHEVVRKIKKTSSNTEVILYAENDDINSVSAAFHYGAYTFIKKNENILLRIENNIVGIINEKNFLRTKQSSKFYTILFIIIATCLFIIFSIYFFF
ncbi:MAG: hypothetical protein U9R54_00960 [Bacteroidota bacterium]|nr:hypothetical protein [Bacteroidota bacterium]